MKLVIKIGTHLLCQVDHFDFQNNEVFNHRYLVNDSWWKEGAPIFFYTGNEGDISWFCNNTVSARFALIPVLV